MTQLFWVFIAALGAGLIILFLTLTQNDDARPRRLEKVRVYIDDRGRRKGQALPPEEDFDYGQAVTWLLLAMGVIFTLILMSAIK